MDKWHFVNNTVPDVTVYFEVLGYLCKWYVNSLWNH